MRTVFTMNEQGHCQSEVCVSCGNSEDETVKLNRTAQAREFWKMRTDEEEKEISREEKIVRENEEEALKYSF